MSGLYVHVPFCRRKCAYCDFSSYAGMDQLVPEYLEALGREMRPHRGFVPETVFIGGGTPSILGPDRSAVLLSRLRETFSWSGCSETTVEANPESLDGDTVRAFREGGVDRLSLGAQSLRDEELLLLGRLHDSRRFREAFDRARRSGFDNVNIDLIYGLPGQTLEAWRFTLSGVVALGPEHISAYPLTVEPGTTLAADGIAPDDDSQALMYEWTLEYLSGAGYEHYELSNWSRPGRQCRHNLNYWRNGEYLGLGSAAASYRNGRRSRNRSDVRAYIEAIGRGEDPVEEEESLEAGRKTGETVILGLRRTAGIELTPGIEERYGEAIRRSVEERLLERAGTSLRLTKRGLLLANLVFERFV